MKSRSALIVKDAACTLLILTIAFVVTLFLARAPVYAQAGSTAVSISPLENHFDIATNGTVGTLFNVTVVVNNVTDMRTWQVNVFYNDTILNVTRWYEPTWDPTYVFYGNTTLAVPPPPKVAYNNIGSGNGSAGVGATLNPAPSPGGGFTGMNGTLCILTFNITAVPPTNQTFTSELGFSELDTFWIKAGNQTKTEFDIYINATYTIPEFSPSMLLLIVMAATIIILVPTKEVFQKSRTRKEQ